MVDPAQLQRQCCDDFKAIVSWPGLLRFPPRFDDFAILFDEGANMRNCRPAAGPFRTALSMAGQEIFWSFYASAVVQLLVETFDIPGGVVRATNTHFAPWWITVSISIALMPKAPSPLNKFARSKPFKFLSPSASSAACSSLLLFHERHEPARKIV